MGMRHHKKAAQIFCVLALSAAFCALLCWQHTAVLSLFCTLTVRQASLLLPAVSAQSAPQQTIPAEDTTKAHSAPDSTRDAAAVPAAPEETAEADLTQTPQDILALIKHAQKSAAADKKAGTIRSLTYTNEGVTDQSGVVKVKNINKTKIDVAKLLRRKADLSVNKQTPCVLIFHTHTTESYQYLDRTFYTAGFPTRDSDPGRNMVRVGDEICAQLEGMGFAVIHDTEIHDAHYNGAYERSRAAIQKYRKQYPSLQVLLDIHRDAIQQSDGTKLKPVAQINGKNAAQVMIISGCQEDGNGVTDFPDWEQNLVFALLLQQKMEQTFPGLTRPVFFSPRRYNMHLSHCSLLLEVGSDSNTLEEAAYSGRLIGHALGLLLQDYLSEEP